MFYATALLVLALTTPFSPVQATSTPAATPFPVAFARTITLEPQRPSEQTRNVQRALGAYFFASHKDETKADAFAAPVAIAKKLSYTFTLTSAAQQLQLLPDLSVADVERLDVAAPMSHDTLSAVATASYTFNDRYSLDVGYAHIYDDTQSLDLRPNADLNSFGSGSSATTWTLAPMYQRGHYFVRCTIAHANIVGQVLPVAPGSHGAHDQQNRIFFELGVQY